MVWNAIIDPQFRGVLHKPRIGIVPDPFLVKAVWLRETTPFKATSQVNPQPQLAPLVPSPPSLPFMQVVPGLPKTRSGKIMRRILRKIAVDQPDQLGDISTLADPAVVQLISEAHTKQQPAR